MKTLNLYIQSALDSLGDCTRELAEAREKVIGLEDNDQDPPLTSTELDQVLAHCQKAERQMQMMAKKVGFRV